ncbi:MAG: hypothetical protein KAS19_07685 [Anaerolineales bacterium]|nr:hypothetical protein [Anaerolineales bacterium]
MTNTKQLTDERGQDYGTPQDNHTRTALLWSAFIHAKSGFTLDEDFHITGEDVCYFNILQKMARDMHGSNKKDTLVDQMGYVSNLLEMRGQLEEG